MHLDLLNYGRSGKSFFEDFVSFAKRRKVVIIVVIVACLLGFGYDIWNFSLSPDEEREIVRAAGTNIDIRNLLLKESRYGAWFIKQILSVDGIFTPCIDTLMAVIFFGISAVVWCMCIECAAGKARIHTLSLCVFAVLYITFPYVIADLFSYGICNSLIGMVFLLGVIGQYDLFKSFLNGGFDWGMIRGILLATFLFLSTEVGITLFALSAAMIAFFYFFYNDKKEDIIRLVFRYIGRALLVFFVSLLLSFLVKLLDTGNNGYQSQFIYWNTTKPLIPQIMSVMSACKQYFTQSKWLGQTCLLMGFILSFISMFVFVILKHNRKALLIVMLYFCVIILSFSMVIICGGLMPVRTMVTLQILSGFVWFITVEVFRKKKAIYTLLITISLYIGFRQIVYLNRAFTGSNLCAQLDMEMGYKIGTDIQRETGKQSPMQPVVFVGRYQHPASNIFMIDASGQSIFYRSRTVYKNYFMTYLGFSFQHASDAVISEAEKRAMTQPAYPLEGYIQVYDDMIVVKLSGAQYYIGETISESEKMSLQDLTIVDSQTPDDCGIGWIGYQGIYFSCNGSRPDDNNEIDISFDGYVSVNGWACDFINRAPLSTLYACVGDKIITCNYNIDRQDVADFFSISSLRDVGFSLLIPSEYLEDDGDTELKFLMVGADGTFVYEPIQFELVY